MNPHQLVVKLIPVWEVTEMAIKDTADAMKRGFDFQNPVSDELA